MIGFDFPINLFIFPSIYSNQTLFFGCTPFGLHDLKLTVELVKAMGKPAGIILNKETGSDAGIDEFARETDIPVLLKIPYSMGIQEAYSRGIPLVDAMPGIRKEFTVLLETITAGGA